MSAESGIEALGTRVHRVPNRYRVVLAIEGGGSRGMFSAGMGLGLEELGLDRHPGHPAALGRHRVAALVSSFSLTSSS